MTSSTRLEVYEVATCISRTKYIESAQQHRSSLSTISNMSLKRKAGDIAADAVKKPKQNASITSFFGAPKPSPSASKTASDPTAPATEPIKFDKDAWVAKLSDEHKELLKLEIDTLHESWLGALKDEVTSESFLNLKRFIRKESEGTAKIFPPLEEVYSW
jgi:uracil-DNA glycosylase